MKPISPYCESAPFRYSRLFPPSQLDPATASEALTELGRAMTDDGNRLSHTRPIIFIDAGYTYFGQFLDHDLTNDTSSLAEAKEKEPHELMNLHAPRLDLGHLYGSGPDDPDSERFYESDRMRLRVGQAGANGRSFDVCVDPISGERILADERSGENLIVRQMTAVFARLHNFAVEQFAEISDPAARFRRARLHTCWQFQWLVCRDFLANVLDPAIYRPLFLEPGARSTIEWNTFSIPIEFSVAAMRFGHSMVRANYRFSIAQELKLGQVFGLSHHRGPIPEELRIDWGFFFAGAGAGPAISARSIDTRLVTALHELPEELIRMFNRRSPPASTPIEWPQLAVRSLHRGALLHSASGQTAARALGLDVLTAQELTCNDQGIVTEQGKILIARDLLRETPLWYYILKESEVRQNGNRLAALGSRIVAETVLAAVKHDPDSYLNHPEAKGQAPVWRLPDGEQPILHLSKLFRTAREL